MSQKVSLDNKAPESFWLDGAAICPIRLDVLISSLNSPQANFKFAKPQSMRVAGPVSLEDDTLK